MEKRCVVAGRHILVGTSETRSRLRGIMQLNYSLTDNETSYLTITNLLGEKQSTYKLINGASLLNIKETGLSNGVYFYQVFKNSNKVYSGKIVISK